MLVVEDNPRHLADAKAIVERIQRQLVSLGVVYAQTLEEALRMLPGCDCVTSDVFFPVSPGGPATSTADLPGPVYDHGYYLVRNKDQITYAEQHISGVRLALAAKALEIPIVLCTSTFHHGKFTQPACVWVRSNGVALVDVESVGDGEAEKKDWASAIFHAIRLCRDLRTSDYKSEVVTLGEYALNRLEGRRDDFEEEFGGECKEYYQGLLEKLLQIFEQ